MTDTPGWSSPEPGGPPPQGWGAPQQPPQWGQTAWDQPQYGWGPPAAPKPGVIPLRPLALGEILDGALTTIRRYPKATLGISAIVVTLVQLINFAITASEFLTVHTTSFDDASFSSTSTFDLATVFTALLGGVATVVLSGLLTVVFGEAVLGRPVSLGDAWRKVRPRIWALLGVAIIAGIGPYVGLVFCLVPGVFLWGALALTGPALILEQQRVFAAVRRSWRLAVPDWWRVFGIRFLAWLLAAMVSFVLMVPFLAAGGIGLFAAGSFSSGEVGVGFLFVMTIGQIVANTIVLPFTAGVLVLLYVDRRMRAEALDVALAQVAAEPSPGALPA